MAKTTAVRTKATVKPGGLIEVRSDELPEGVIVDVIVLLEAPETETAQMEAAKPEETKPKGLVRFIGAAKGSFVSIAEVDEYIRQERDSWDS